MKLLLTTADGVQISRQSPTSPVLSSGSKTPVISRGSSRLLQCSCTSLSVELQVVATHLSDYVCTAEGLQMSSLPSTVSRYGGLEADRNFFAMCSARANLIGVIWKAKLTVLL